jgi:hypothetical protein
MAILGLITIQDHYKGIPCLPQQFAAILPRRGKVAANFFFLGGKFATYLPRQFAATLPRRGYVAAKSRQNVFPAQKYYRVYYRAFYRIFYRVFTAYLLRILPHCREENRPGVESANIAGFRRVEWNPWETAGRMV